MIVIYSEEMGNNKESFQMTLSGKGLDKKDLIGKSDPFTVSIQPLQYSVTKFHNSFTQSSFMQVISKKNDDDEGWTEVFTTEVVINKKNKIKSDMYE